MTDAPFHCLWWTHSLAYFPLIGLPRRRLRVWPTLPIEIPLLMVDALAGALPTGPSLQTIDALFDAPPTGPPAPTTDVLLDALTTRRSPAMANALQALDALSTQRPSSRSSAPDK